MEKGVLKERGKKRGIEDYKGKVETWRVRGSRVHKIKKHIKEESKRVKRLQA